MGLKVTVKFFAYLRDIFRGRKEQIELPSGSSVGDLLNLLCDSQARREQIFDCHELRPQMMVLKNGNHIQHFRGLDTILEDEDTIVLIPPVGGG
jgi:molybdopterin synthase sulfur carrier subunit